MPLPRLQPLTRSRVASLGSAGAAWHTRLPTLMAELEALWNLRIDRSLPGGSASYVARARRADGSRAVLKIALPDPGFTAQAEVLRRADGRGYARLLAVDQDRQALLLEELGPSLDRAGREPEAQLAVLADVLLDAWQDASGRPEGPDKAAELRAYVERTWRRLDRPCSSAVIAQAVAYADRLVDPPPESLVVVHGDPHPGNLLRVLHRSPAPRTGYALVDPDGFVADRAYDLGVALRDWSSRLTGPDARSVAERFCTLLADRTGVDAGRIWRWGFLERVSTGLYVLDLGAPAVARPFLDTAERLLD